MCEVEKVPNYFCARSFRRTEKKKGVCTVQEKKKERKGKERKIWLDSIDFFTKDRGAKFYCDFPRVFFPV